MISKQLLLGASLIIGGGVVLYALSQDNNPIPTASSSAGVEDVARPVVQPLTADTNTEERIIAQKQQEREARTLAQEREAKALLLAQERAEALALQKAESETKNIASDDLTVQTRPEALEALEVAKKEAAAKARAETKAREKQEKAEQTKKQEKTKEVKAERKKDPQTDTKATKTNGHKVVRGDTLIKLSRRYDVPVSALAAANKMGQNDSLPAGKTLKIPSKSQIARLEREVKKSQAKEEAAATADKRLKQARQTTAGDTASKGRYSVQVSLADNQAKADEVAKKYRAAGYKVSTSPTSRGVRVLVGSEKSTEAASALRDKIRNDDRVDGNGAWVKRIK